jgi:hypothetical protein
MDWIADAPKGLGAAFFHQVDAVLVGSRSFGVVHYWPHGNCVVVLSSSKTAKELDIPAALAATVSVCQP